MRVDKSKILWGIIFILATVYMLAGQFGVLPDASIVRIVFTILLAWTVIQGICKWNFYEIFIPLAILYAMYDEILGAPEISLWPAIGTAVLCSIGFSLLFNGIGKKKKNVEIDIDMGDGQFAFGGDSSEQCHGEQIRVENNFGTAIRYINSDDFKGAELENKFGSLSVYFDNAIIQTGSASVNVDNNFGETKLYIPKEWKVVDNLPHAFGSVNMKGRCEGTSNCVLYLNGSTDFGTVTIYYI